MEADNKGDLKQWVKPEVVDVDSAIDDVATVTNATSNDFFTVPDS